MDDGMTAVERAAYITFLLLGQRAAGLSTRAIAARLGMSRGGALRLLQRISRVTPIRQDEKWLWRACEEREVE